jgi:uncharacterized protein (DUF2267 family)
LGISFNGVLAVKYPDLVDRVQNYSGFTRHESEEALQVMIESLSVHLGEPYRKDFASQLPERLEAIALSVYPTKINSKQEILLQIMYLQKIDQNTAKKQVKAAWQAIKDTVSRGQIKQIKSQLPKTTLTYLD